MTRAQKSQALPWTQPPSDSAWGWEAGGANSLWAPGGGQHGPDGGAHGPARDPRARGRSAAACGLRDPLRPRALPAAAAPPALSPQEELRWPGGTPHEGTGTEVAEASVARGGLGLKMQDPGRGPAGGVLLPHGGRGASHSQWRGRHACAPSSRPAYLSRLSSSSFPVTSQAQGPGRGAPPWPPPSAVSPGAAPPSGPAGPGCSAPR